MSGYFLFALSEWVIRIVMLFVITGRMRRTSSAVVWLMVVFFVPWVGAPLYLVVGMNRIPRRRAERRRVLLQVYERIRPTFESDTAPAESFGSERYRPFVDLADKLGNFPKVRSNDYQMMTDTDAVINRLVADIDGAKEHVHLLFYIWGADGTGERVADALARAAARGVECRVLVDAVGSRPMLRKLARGMRERGIKVRAALPVSLLRGLVARIDLRNHRKIAVIDGAAAYTGSQNIIDAGYGRSDLAWDDLMLRVNGPIVRQLQAVFVADWFSETGELLEDARYFPEPDRSGTVAIQTLPSGPHFEVENFQRLTVHALHSAQTRVTITTPYFIPDEPFLEAMETAVLRGVRVVLIVPERSDQFVVGYASRAYYEELLQMGVEIHLYQPGLIHSKTMSIDDDLVFVGTSNFDIRSFELNFEVTLILYCENTSNQLNHHLDRYLAGSYRLDAETWRRRPAPKRVVQNIMRLFSPLL